MDSIFTKIESMNHFELIVKEILCNLHEPKIKETFPENIDINVIEAAKQEFRHILGNYDYDTTKITQHFINKGWSQEKIDYFEEVLEKEITGILTKILHQKNSSYGEVITDFDWLVKLVFGTSELKTMQYALTQLIITSTTYHSENKASCYDIQKDVLEKLINILETIVEK